MFEIQILIYFNLFWVKVKYHLKVVGEVERQCKWHGLIFSLSQSSVESRFVIKASPLHDTSTTVIHIRDVVGKLIKAYKLIKTSPLHDTSTTMIHIRDVVFRVLWSFCFSLYIVFSIQVKKFFFFFITWSFYGKNGFILFYNFTQILTALISQLKLVALDFI